MMEMKTFSRKDATRVSLAYRYHQPKWDLEQNLAVYGADHNVEGIGGNMTIWLEMAGEADGKTRLLIPEKSLHSTLSYLKSTLDHRCLFEVEPWFESRVPTLENIALFLKEKIQRQDWHSLTVEENENWRMQIFCSSQLPRLTFSTLVAGAKASFTIEGAIDSVSGLMISRAKFATAVTSWGQNLNSVSLYAIEELKKVFPNLLYFRWQSAFKTGFEGQLR